ncbi:hypothetical protein R5R35_005951 [Gryllus longicercus]|uniref:C2H2-type domain-containing protein n=1 Tax=Gryllus longicercus TaxID=2509291 RepID=A0AAN9V8R7_9ORTH
MNFTHFNGHFPVHQFSAAKFSNPQIQPGTMIVTSASDGTIQYIRPEHNGANFITSSASNSPVQSIPVTVNIPVPSDHRSGSIEQDVATSQSTSQHQLAAVVNAPVNKYPHAPGTLLGWGEIPMMHHFDASKNLTALNVPYPHQGVNNSAFLTMQPPPTSSANPGMWPVKLMQSVATMTNEESDTQPQDLCKVEEDKTKNSNGDVKSSPVLKSEQIQKESCDSEDDSEDSSKSGVNITSNATNEENRSESLSVSVPVNPMPNGSLECSQIQLQQQGSAMADYLARLPSTIPFSLQQFLKYQTETAPSIKREGEASSLAGMFLGNTAITPIVNNQAGASSPKKKKKKKSQKRPPRPKPGEIRVSTALDGSTLFCCPECHMAYPDRDLLQQHMSGHKMERRFVCNICGAGLKRKEHLDQHKKGHSDERPFVCSVCMKGFKRNEHLTRHFVIHSGEKTHACWECGKKFSRKDHLHKHTQTHIAKRVKAEMSQDSLPGGVPVSLGGSVVSPPVSTGSSTPGASTPQSVLTTLSPQIPMQHSILPNIPHPLQLHHSMS